MRFGAEEGAIAGWVVSLITLRRQSVRAYRSGDSSCFEGFVAWNCQARQMAASQASERMPLKKVVSDCAGNRDLVSRLLEKVAKMEQGCISRKLVCVQRVKTTVGPSNSLFTIRDMKGFACDDQALVF